MNRKKKLLITGLSVAVLLTAYGFATSYAIYRPIPFNQVALSQAVTWVRANASAAHKGSDTGAVPLPPQLASVSATGEAYVSGTMIFFPSQVGHGTLLPDPFGTDASWMEGYGFSTRPLHTMDTTPAGSDQFFYTIDDRELAVGGQINPHWYAIDSFS